MINYFCCAILLGISTVSLHAQKNDTTRYYHLDEVVVNAKSNIADAKGLYYIPSGQQKNSAQNGIDLLRRMAIPQIKVGLADDNVRTKAGKIVSIYINYTKASSEELEGLRTSDVRKVEYFFSPSDQRFMGDRNVINIIVQPYEYGGYSKVSLSEKFLIGLSSNASLYSKFTYKKMTYDLFVGSRNSNNHHNGSEIVGEYLLYDINRVPVWIERVQKPESMRFSQNLLPVSFRASYSKRGFQMKNTIGFSFQEIPNNSSDGILSFNPDILAGKSYSNAKNSRMNSLSYNGSFNFNFNNQYYLTLTPKASYVRNHQNYCYASSDNSITNNAEENNHSFSMMAMGRKIISDVHYLFIRVFGGHTHYAVNYTGSTISSDRINESYGGASFQYGYYTNSLTADFMVGIRCEGNITDGNSETEIYPFASANFGWSPNGRHSLNLGISYSKEPMNANLKSPNVIPENELLYYSGNPGLRYSPNIMVNLGYNYSPNNWLQISPFTQFYGIFDRYVPKYSSYLDGQAIIRRYENDGNHFRIQIGIGATANLLDGRLQLQVAPSQFLYKSTGYYNMNYCPLTFSGSIVYYLDKFYLSGFYEMKNRTLWTNSGTIYKDKSQMQFSLGWSNSILNVRLGIANPFRSSWECATTEFHTPVYNERQTTSGTTTHCNINFSMTYTIGYGKKVRQGNEIGEQNNGTSAILR